MGPNLHQPLYAHTPAIVCTYTCLCYALGTVVLRLFMSVDVCLNIMLSKWPCVQPTQQTTVVHKQPIYMALCISTYIPYWHWASLSLSSLSPPPSLPHLFSPFLSTNLRKVGMLVSSTSRGTDYSLLSRQSSMSQLSCSLSC